MESPIREKIAPVGGDMQGVDEKCQLLSNKELYIIWLPKFSTALQLYYVKSIKESGFRNEWELACHLHFVMQN